MKPRKTLRMVLFWCGWLIAVPLCLWCFAAIWYSNLPLPWMRHSAAIFFAGLMLTAALPVRKWPKTVIAAVAALVAGVMVWWLLIPASNEGDWQTPFARMPEAGIEGDRVTIVNIRDFQYRSETDYTPRYRRESYLLSELRTVDFALCYWDGNLAIAHTMLSFGFSDGRHLVFSSETRLKNGQAQGALPGLFKQYNILFIVGTEEDLFKLRTNYRREQLYLYPATMPAEGVRRMFLSLLSRCDEQLRRPKFYNTLTFNCTTSLMPSLPRNRVRGFDIRFYLNGYSDEMAFENGGLKHRPGESFAEYKARHYVNQYAEKFKDGDNYSRLIRPEGVF